MPTASQAAFDPISDPKTLSVSIKTLYNRIWYMPEMIFSWNTDDPAVPGKQLQAHSSQVLERLYDMVTEVEAFAAKHPGRRVTPHDFSAEFWTMLGLATGCVEGLDARSLELSTPTNPARH